MKTETINLDEEKYGAIVVQMAEEYGQTVEHAFTDILFNCRNMSKVVDSKGTRQVISTLPGIHLDENKVSNSRHKRTHGPAHKRIMVVGCGPNAYENNEKCLGKGEWLNEFKTMAKSSGFPIDDVYYTTYVKYFVDGKKVGIPKEVIAEFAPMFKRELELVNPELVILLGAKVLKAVFGNKATVDQYKSRTIAATESPLGVKTTVITDFAAIQHMPDVRSSIALDVTRLANELRANTSKVQDCVTANYVYCSTLSHLQAELTKLEQSYEGWMAVDCEWGGTNFKEGELRCIQFCGAPGEALVAIFNNEGMVPTELGLNKPQAWAMIKALIENGKTRLIGHFIRADLPWIQHNGVNINLATVAGWDTALAGHLLNENWAQGLETYTARHTQMGRYEVPLNEWIKSSKYDTSTLGYGGIPDNILYEYAAKDADVTFRIFLAQLAELRLVANAKLLKLFQTVIMPATLPILEIETTGMNVDIARLEFLSQKYTTKRADLTHKLQDLLAWPEFNPDSSQQKATALFSWIKPGSKTSPPAGVKLRRFIPIKATSDKKWSEVMKHPDSMGSYTPSTDRSTISELLLSNSDDEFLNTLLLYTAVSQTVKTFTGEFVVNEVVDGDSEAYTIEGGIRSKLWNDGRVHTRIRQTIETGRYGHSDPNMAQLPKTAEDLVGKAFKDDGNNAIPSIRSCFTADPGWCLVDCDWVQAELVVMAWLSEDSNMQQKLNDPGADFHSEVAIDMFKLPAPPSDYTKSKKDWLKENQYLRFRTIAKTIVFGIAYGRGAAAIQQAVRMEGIDISVAEAQDAIIGFKTTFPDLAYWLERQQSLVTTVGYVENGFGRRRRFEPTNDKELIAQQERQAMNAPIQGTVGDLMSLALVNLFMLRETEYPHLQYKILMSVHDQIIISCPVGQVDETLEVMRVAMCEKCKIPGIDLLLKIDPEICLRWNETLTNEDVSKYPTLAKYKH